MALSAEELFSREWSAVVFSKNVLLLSLLVIVIPMHAAVQVNAGSLLAEK